MNKARFYFGTWEIHPASNSILYSGARRQLEPRAMEVLVALCERAGSVVSADDLLTLCWGNRASGDNPVHKTITQLRRLLGDSATAPSYIETIRKRGYRTLATVVAQADATPAPWRHGSPFRGLEAFDAEHAAVFFGRADATIRLQQALAGQLAAGTALQLVLGPSGSGKSSLVRAGLLPALLAAPASVACALTVDLGELAGRDLFVDLASAMLDWDIDGVSLFPGSSASTLGRALERDPAGVAGRLDMELARHGRSGQRCALFIDGLEALFVPATFDARQISGFIALLDAFAHSTGVLLVAACRNDFYAHIAAVPLLMEGKERGAHFDLAAPSHAELAQIIRLPARAAQLYFGTDERTGARLDEVLCEHAFHSPDALPLLQYTLQELYRQRGTDGELSFAAFARLGGMEGAIAKRAEDALAAMDDIQRACLPQILALMVAMAPQDDLVSSRRVPAAALTTPAARATVAALVEARLLVSELVSGKPGFGVAHEAVLRHWPRATAWIAQHRGALRTRERCATLAARWQEARRPDDLLLPPGQQLNEALALLQMPALALSDGELALIRESRQRARRRERIRFGAIATIAALAVLAAGLGFSAVAEKRVAQRRSADAEGLLEFMLGDFADKLRPLGRLDLLDSVSAKALAYLANPVSDGLGPTAQIQRAKALQQLAEVQIARGAPKPAAAALEAARAILLRRLRDDPRERAVLLSLGANAFWLGQIQLDQSHWDAAGEAMRAYRDYSDQVYALDPKAADAWIEQSYAHNSLGTLALRRGDASSAAAEFARSISLKQRALAKTPADTALVAELADSVSWAATALEANGQLDAAALRYQQQLQMLEAVHQTAPADNLWTFRLAVAKQNKARLDLAIGQDGVARATLGQAQRLLARLIATEPANRRWQANLVFADMELARIDARDAPAAALKSLFAALQRAQLLHRQDDTQHEWERLTALAQRHLADALAGNGQTVQALSYLNAALQGLERLLALNPADVYTREALADALLSMARLDQPRARTSCAKVQALLGADAERSADYRVLAPWVQAKLCLADDGAAKQGKERLHQLGYRDAEYLRFIHFNKKGQL